MRAMIKNIIKRFPIIHSVFEYKNRKKFLVLNEEEKRCAELYRQLIKPHDLVFDVGANMGSRTKVFLDLNARVVAFEPQKICSDYLKLVLKNENDFRLVEMALGDKECEGEMFISDVHAISTLSQQWTKVTKESGRFSKFEWSEKQHVRITTLDHAIQEFGIPDFIKIDVEGYELEVLSGLTNPIRCISIEFAAENIENTYECIDYMSSLSEVTFQYSTGESMKFDLPMWVSDKEMKRFLADISDQNKMAWGDVYIKDSGINA